MFIWCLLDDCENLYMKILLFNLYVFGTYFYYQTFLKVVQREKFIRCDILQYFEILKNSIQKYFRSE